MDKRLISTEELVITRRGETKANCWIKKAVQNGSSIYALCPNAVSINKVLRHEVLKKKWESDTKAKFTEITYRDSIIPPGQLKRLFGEIDDNQSVQSNNNDNEECEKEKKDEDENDEKKITEEKEEEKEKEDEKEEGDKKINQTKQEYKLPHKRPKNMNRVKVNKLSWISLE